MSDQIYKKPVTQEFGYGCAIACAAFSLGLSYKQTESLVGEKQAVKERFWVKDLNEFLNSQDLEYSRKHVKTATKEQIESEGTIVLLRRSELYPTGHYLARHKNLWMDPWINMKDSGYDISKARSGYRKRLPGKVMYVIYAL
jgi:hypothetical protein